MNGNRASLLLSVGAAALMMGLSGGGLSSASAQSLMLPTGPASNVVTFGDSLSDAGNFKGQNPGAGFNAPYLAGATFVNGAPNPLPLNLNRFTNGLTWAEILAARTPGGAPRLFGTGAVPGGANVNYAFGGSRSDATPALIGTEATLGPALGINGVVASPTAAGNAPPRGDGPAFGIANVPGLPNQIAAFTASGGRFGPNTLVTIWSGANDIFQAASAYPTPQQAAIAPVLAAQNVGTAVGQVAALGARTIVVNNLPDFGATPSSIAGGPAAIAQGNAASGAYNTTLAQAVQAAAAANPGASVILVDVNKAFRDISANPARYGFTNVTSACALTPACVTGNAATQATFAFWDTVHPTGASHALVAALAADYLAAGAVGAEVAGLNDFGASLRRQASSAAVDRVLDTQGKARVLGAGAVGVNEVSVQVDGATSNAGGASLSGGAVRVLVDRAITSEVRIGAAISYGFGSARLQTLRSGVTGFSADIYAGYGGREGFFAAGALGLSANQFGNIRRTTLFGVAVNTASTNGTAFSIEAMAGWAFRLSPAATISPFVGLSYLTSSVSAFQEAPSATAQLAFAGRSASTFAGLIGLRADMALAKGVSGHLGVAYSHVFSRNDGALAVSILGGPSQIAPTVIRTPKRHEVLLSAGISGAITDSVSIGLDYRASIPTSGGGSSHLGRVSLNVKF